MPAGVSAARLAAPAGHAAQPQPDGLRIVVIEGEDAVNVVQQRSAVAPVIEVRDRNNQPVAGAVVRFAVRRGQATFGGARSVTVTTNAVARAVASGLAPTGTGAVEIAATASFQGESVVATLTQTNVMTAAQVGGSAGAAGGGGGGAAGGGGGSASGASGAAGGGGVSGGTGLSATTLGVVGGAAAGGALFVAEKVGDSGGARVYAGPLQGNLTITFRLPSGALSCVRTHAYDGTVRLELSVAPDGTASGEGSAQSTNGVTAVTCSGGPQLNSREDAGSGTGTIVGTASSLTWSIGQSNSGPGFARSDAYQFTGSVQNDTVVGTLVLTVTISGGPDTGTGTVSFPVTLR